MVIYLYKIWRERTETLWVDIHQLFEYALIGTSFTLIFIPTDSLYMINIT